MREVVGDRQVARLLGVVGSWAAAENAFLLAASVLALDLGGPAAVGLVGAARVLPAAVSAPFVTALADRVPRAFVIAAVNAAFVVVSVAAAAVAWSGAALPALLLVVGAGSVLSSLVKPSMQALLPQLTDSPPHLIAAQSAWSSVGGLGTVLGPALAGVLMAAAGPGAVFLALAGLHAATALVAAAIRSPFRVSRLPQRSARRWLDPLRGLRTLTGTGARQVVALMLVWRAMYGLLPVVLVLQAQALIGPDAERLTGGLFAAVGVGGMIASLAMLVVGGRSQPLWFSVGLALYGFPLVVVGSVGGEAVTWVAVVAMGFGSALVGIFSTNLVSRLLPDHVAGRAWGGIHALSAVATAVGALCAPWLVGLVGLPQALVLAGGAVTLAPALGWRGLRAAQARTTARSDDLALLAGVPVLRPLPGLSIEQLACVAERRQVPAGDVVVQEGDPGHEFFVVASGSLLVSRRGRPLRQLGTGEAFGEVALLRTVPRTATVSAATDAELLCVGQELFIATVTGHRPTDASAEAVVTHLLEEDARREKPGA